MKSKVEVNPKSIRILKIATCPSLSGKSKLIYNVGVDDKGEIHVRVHANSSSGFFSRVWTSMSEIHGLLAKVPSDKPLTSFMLHPLFAGTSQNNCGFIWAILRAEGLIELHPEKQRCYSLTDGKKFFAEVKTLIDSGVSLHVDEPVKRGTKKTAAEVTPIANADQAKRGRSKKTDTAIEPAVVETPVVPSMPQPLVTKGKRMGKAVKSIAQSALEL